MIHHLQGNLLTSDCNVIIHQSNCHKGFASGIAGQIRKAYPNAYITFMNDNRKPEDKLGSYTVAFDKGKIIYNQYSQFYYGNDPDVVYTKYDAFEKALKTILSVVRTDTALAGIQDIKIGMPYLIGCGLANGSWAIVRDMIESCSKEFKRDIYLYEYVP